MKVGLVLAGGGSRGAYQIGVWKALTELGIDKHIQVISGTSIGALNTILFLQGDLKKAEDIWSEITKDKILPMDDKELVLKRILFNLGAKNISFIKKYIPKVVKAGTISREGLDEILENVDISVITKSKVKVYAACTIIPELKAEYFKLNDRSVEDIKKIIHATSAVPMIYDSQIIENINYLDGAITDNVPIQPVYGEGCNIIIVVHLSNDSLVDTCMFPNTNIIEIVPSDMCGLDLKETLDFDINMIKKRMTNGYKDTMYKFKPIMDIARLIDNGTIVEKTTSNKVIAKINNIFKSKYKEFK